jgi:hypothetical protein
MDKKDFLPIITLLEDNENTKIKFEMDNILKRYEFHGNGNGTELFLREHLPSSLVIQRVGLINKRKGTMSSILNELINLCRIFNFDSIIIQSVMTSAMKDFCIKKGFSHTSNTGVILPDELLDYKGDELMYFGNFELKVD